MKYKISAGTPMRRTSGTGLFGGHVVSVRNVVYTEKETARCPTLMAYIFALPKCAKPWTHIMVDAYDVEVRTER